ncbi:MAG: hypothetical protein BGO16_02850 [Nitrobacter sp. 62-23]|nr:MAG: hypothetical protein BGO16_02850 [Nitrobacter sp. 62-23]
MKRFNHPEAHIRAIVRDTCTADHAPMLPRGCGMPRAVRAFAISLRDPAPAFLISAMIGARSSAFCAALALAASAAAF